MRQMPVLEAFELYSKNKRYVRKRWWKRSRHTGNIRRESGMVLMSHAILSIRGDVGVDSCYTRNIRRVNERKLVVREAFDLFRKNSESVREETGVILNQTSRSSCIRKGFGNDSRRMLDVCGKDSPQKCIPLLSGYSEPKFKKKYSRNVRNPILFSVTGP